MMYNVQTMKHLKVAEARARFGDILDEAEKGNAVVIERRGVLFRLQAESPSARPKASPGSPFTKIDADVMSGQWTWTAGAKGLRFSARRKKR
jgi:prevent-host-death family protein